MLLIGSPMCTASSSLQELSRSKRDPAEFEKMLTYARKHLGFCIDLYKLQVEANRYFLHEHAHNATTWSEPSMQSLLRIKGVVRVRGDIPME